MINQLPRNAPVRHPIRTKAGFGASSLAWFGTRDGQPTKAGVCIAQCECMEKQTIQIHAATPEFTALDLPVRRMTYGGLPIHANEAGPLHHELTRCEKDLLRVERVSIAKEDVVGRGAALIDELSVPRNLIVGGDVSVRLPWFRYLGPQHRKRTEVLYPWR